MEPYKDVIASRAARRQDAAKNSVHRSSLLVPELPGAVAEFAFANHFLMKRHIARVGCRVTGIDEAGKRIESRLFAVDEPRVYRCRPEELIGRKAAMYGVEFFAAENLHYPFPAVMVNHLGDGFANAIHSYNRVLNDVFENDAINARVPWESAIDVALDERTDTRIFVAAGPVPCRGTLELELIAGGTRHARAIPLDVPRLAQRMISIGEVFADVRRPVDGFLRVHQPAQPMFYGRLFAGRWRGDAFAANHSYYDSSATEEYWDTALAHARSYPWFPGAEAGLRIYPIMSPGRLAFRVLLHGHDGRALGNAEIGSVTSPSSEFLTLWLGGIAKNLGVAVEDVGAFTLEGRTLTNRTPTRITHQVLYRDARGQSLPSSVNISLADPNTPVAADKSGLTWCQTLVGADYDSRIALQLLHGSGASDRVEIEIYDETGLLGRRTAEVAPRGAAQLDLGREFPGNGVARPVWVYATGARADLTSFSLTRHKASGAVTAEHGF
jgi:hypothetical protein